MKIYKEHISGFFLGFWLCTLIAIAIEVYNGYKQPPPPHQIKAILQGSYDGKQWHTIDSLLIPTK